jgi:hypothetical protein
MAVKVVGTHQQTQDGVEHADGSGMIVRDGHLFVIESGDRAAAIYAPGQGLWAEVTK